MVLKLNLNWIGMYVSDFEGSLRFYTEGLGMKASSTKLNWAYFETTGMTFELFGGGLPPTPDRKGWGQGQTIRPAIQVADLREIIANLRQRGVQFVGEIEQRENTEWIEFVAPEEMRWTFVQAPAYPFNSVLEKTHIGWIELKVDHLAEQRAFYSEILGVQPEEDRQGRVIFRQNLGKPCLFLEEGGKMPVRLKISQGVFQPLPSHLISLETDNIEKAAAWLKFHKIPILIEITRKNWGGIDLYITDPDGNPIQVVQYIQS